MRFLIQVSILGAIAWQGAGKSTPTIVDVYLGDRDGSSKLLGSGTWVASGIFARIGVHVKWHTGEPLALRSDGPDAVLRPAFGIRTVDYAPESATRGALASSELHGSSVAVITVYKDQVRSFFAEHPTLHEAAPGYILAHELAHVMQGLARHSTTGILTAKWSSDDYNQMKYHVLAFTRSDVELIHQGLARKLASLGAATVVQRESDSPATLSSTQR